MAVSKTGLAKRILLGCAFAVGGAMSLRYFYLDNDAVRTVCDAAPDRWFCTLRGKISLVLRHPAGGWVILALTVLTLLRPKPLALAFTFVLTALGLVLYQADLASGSLALLLLQLAIRHQAGEQQREPA